VSHATHDRIFTSLNNFRDVGGVTTPEGRGVATGRLYRSDTLTRLSTIDLATFDAMGIRTVFDLRRRAEIAEYGRVPDALGRRYVNLSPDHELWEPVPYDASAGPARFLADRYMEIAVDGARAIAGIVGMLAEPGTCPAVVHCFAGKDRTGVVIAIILGLVGVDDDGIADDYALSKDWTGALTLDDVPNHWLVAPRDAMTFFLRDVRARFGSMDGYAASAGIAPVRVTALRAQLLD
jgi:protein tyrosine/serine phosphatase